MKPSTHLAREGMSCPFAWAWMFFQAFLAAASRAAGGLGSGAGGSCALGAGGLRSGAGGFASRAASGSKVQTLIVRSKLAVARRWPSGEKARLQELYICAKNACLMRPVLASQTRTGPSEPAMATSRPSGDTATLQDAASHGRVRVHCPLARSQIRTVWSSPVDAARFPSGKKATDRTWSPWPKRDFRRTPVATSHSISDLSRLPVRRRAPSGEKATDSMVSWCPGRVLRTCHVAVSQSLAVKSQLPEARCVPSGEKATQMTSWRWPLSVVRSRKGGPGRPSGCLWRCSKAADADTVTSIASAAPSGTMGGSARGATRSMPMGKWTNRAVAMSLMARKSLPSSAASSRWSSPTTNRAPWGPTRPRSTPARRFLKLLSRPFGPIGGWPARWRQLPFAERSALSPRRSSMPDETHPPPGRTWTFAMRLFLGAAFLGRGAPTD